MISRVDRPALEMLATSYARFRAAAREVEENGPLSEGSRGQPKESPAVRIEREAARDYLRFAEQFGLTASARTRLGLAELQRRRSMAQELRGSGRPKLKPVD